MIELTELKPGVKIQGEPDAPVMKVVEVLVEMNRIVLDVPGHGVNTVRLDVIRNACSVIEK